MNETAIINYPGSKKKLLDFIYTNTYKYIEYFGIGHEATPIMKRRAVEWLAEKLQP